MNRRRFARQVAGAVVGSALVTSDSGAERFSPRRHGERSTAVLFDALALFDTRPIAFVAEETYPGRGAALMASWRARQFEYAWLRVMTGHYADFWQCTDDSLRWSAASLGLPLAAAQRHRLMDAHLNLRPWPDVRPALEALRSAGVRAGVLSNFSPAMLDAAIRGNGLESLLPTVISTHEARTYKPDPRAYGLGIEALRLPRERIVFAAFAGWDAAGAKLFGYPTYWVNRLQAPAEELGAPVADGNGRTLADLAAFMSAFAPR
jgi:2-haloacid dehalogenase